MSLFASASPAPRGFGSAKWFTKPIPPNNVNLNFPMTDAVREVFRTPNNKGV